MSSQPPAGPYEVNVSLRGEWLRGDWLPWAVLITVAPWAAVPNLRFPAVVMIAAIVAGAAWRARRHPTWRTGDGVVASDVSVLATWSTLSRGRPRRWVHAALTVDAEHLTVWPGRRRTPAAETEPLQIPRLDIVEVSAGEKTLSVRFLDADGWAQDVLIHGLERPSEVLVAISPRMPTRGGVEF